MDQTKTLFQLTTELTDKKVEIAVVKSISEVVDLINELKHEMIERFSKVESRLAALETAVGKRNQSRHEIRSRLYDFAFKACWILLGSGLMYFASHFSAIIYK